jgi:mannan endo-1,4-beta-mannosidase
MVNKYYAFNCRTLLLLLSVLFFTSCKKHDNDFITLSKSQFVVNGKPYVFLGTNFWYGLNLGANDSSGDRQRLVRELDRLQKLGINNLRVMAGTEGPDNQPYRMLPSLQTSPGVYNEKVAEGLDFLLSEMKKRNMYAVMCLNNFWNWSGGMGQYLVWADAADSIPHPPPHPGGSWNTYQEFAASFYSSDKAVELFNNHIRYIISRKNSVTGQLYKDDPTIMSWELANEPRGVNNKLEYRTWVNETCALIKNLDANHLVTLGSEGRTSSDYAGVEPEQDHASKDVDYMTIHIWVQNWNVYNPAKADSTLPLSIDYAKKYLQDHTRMAERLGKPLVLEEFGISRDQNDHRPNGTTTVRDQYYDSLFNFIYTGMRDENPVIAGVNFWAWGGEGRPPRPEGMWKINDAFIGDPPHEPQGWYSVYDNDSSTLKILKKYADQINTLTEK